MASSDINTVIATRLAQIGRPLCSGDMIVTSIAFALAPTHTVHVTLHGSIISTVGDRIHYERTGQIDITLSDDVIACIKGVMLSGCIASPDSFIRVVNRMIGAIKIQTAIRPLETQLAKHRSELDDLAKALTAIERVSDMEDTVATLMKAIAERTELIKGFERDRANMWASLERS